MAGKIFAGKISQARFQLEVILQGNYTECPMRRPKAVARLTYLLLLFFYYRRI
jgi:hypothetical protein